MKTPKQLLVLLVFVILATPLYAERNLDVKNADLKDVRHSMLGFRNTLMFYIFKDQKAVLTLTVDNKDETFPVKGKVYLFEEATLDGDLAKWVNNRHSDALFADAPKPIYSYDLPAGVCKASSFKKTGSDKNPRNNEVYHTYQVELTVKTHSVDKKFKLSGFTDTAKVHVKGK
ncbi:MAG: hypothetical protein KJO79_09090 [Verrucomicrobiae bacterium]|nr:hypothetical protein [Verrucomicrobiae bacterium]NNJ87324.1 hypothetical protein [Akkermansiaceae bacterium]